MAMSTFSVPILPTSDIITFLSQCGIDAVKPEDLANPTADLVCTVYTKILSFLDPLGDDPNDQIEFTALQLLENPDYHTEAIRTLNFYHKVKEMLSAIQWGGFMLRDLLRPDPRRTAEILSAIINFILYREEKLNMLQPIVGQYVDDQFPSQDERRAELEAKIAELNREILAHEVSCEMEQPIVQELDAEVKELKQNIHNLNKEHVALKGQAKVINEKIKSTEDKISQADFELLKNAQENSKLLSKIVQSPDKLQTVLEEKKAYRAEVKNAERAASLSVQAKTTTLDVYSKACEKISRHLAKVQGVQEQVNSAKTVDKEVKALREKLSDQKVSSVSLDAKIDELQGKAKQAEEHIKVFEKERDGRYTELTQKLNTVKSEMEWKLRCLEPRERKVEPLVAKANGIMLEVDSVRDSGKAKQRELLAKSEEIVNAIHSYSNLIDPFLERVEVEVEGILVSANASR